MARSSHGAFVSVPAGSLDGPLDEAAFLWIDRPEAERAAVGPADRMVAAKWLARPESAARTPVQSISSPSRERRGRQAMAEGPSPSYAAEDAAALRWIRVPADPERVGVPQDSPHDVAELGAIKIERMEMHVTHAGHDQDDHDTPSDEQEIKREFADADEAARARALELKRLRNRECMRRSRTRKMGEIAAMKTEIAQLEQQLRAMQLQRAAALGGDDNNHDHDATRLVDALQRENFTLRDEIRGKDKLREIVAPLLEQEEQRIALDEQQREYEERHADQFAWLRPVLPLLALKALTPEDVAALVAQSCEQILASASLADASIEHANRVFGWSDKRVVDDQYVRFVFSKDFAHERVEDVTAKSWETSRDLAKVNAFQPREQRMVCLQRWGDDAIVLARNLNVPQRCPDGSELERNYCSVMLVFRVQTPTGFVVGTRTLEPDRVQHALLRAGEFRVTYVDLCYGLLFSPLHGDMGCNVRFGGRAGNGTRVYAKVCAMDVLLATLRWENHCIAPLNRLTTDVR